MQQNLPFETRLNLPLGENSKLDTILEKRAHVGEVTVSAPLGPEELIWQADYFQLEQTVFFKNLNEAAQFRILKTLNMELLTEIFFIERCGMYYAAKMGLLAESAKERAMFGIMSGDESLHYLWVSSICGPMDPDAYKHQSFLKFLDAVLLEEDKNILIAVIQVILEGWGLRHYRKLADFSHHQNATTALRQIIKDEAYHHGAGLILFDAEKQTRQKDQRLTDILKEFFDMIRCGPQRVLASVENEVGRLNQNQRLVFFESLRGYESAQENLTFLKGLLQSTKISKSILSALDETNRFTPFTTREFADFI
jgi:hypothetical protein